MNIAHLMLAADGGGIQAAFVEYAHALAALGHRQTCFVAPQAWAQPRLPAGVAVQSLSQMGEWDPLAKARLRGALRAMGPQIVLSHGKRAGALAAAARPEGAAHVHVLHRYRFKGLEAFDRVWCVTEDLRARAVASGAAAARAATIGNFLARPGYGAEARVPRDPPTIGFLGRLTPEKGCDLLLEAMALLLGRGEAVHAIIAGAGPEEAKLKAQAQALGLGELARFTGWVDDPAHFWPQIDLLVLPSRSESFGLVILEAWRAGAPVLATRTQGPQSVIRDGVSGALMEPEPQAIAESLSALLAAPDRMARLAQAGQGALAGYSLAHWGPVIDRELNLARAPAFA